MLTEPRHAVVQHRAHVTDDRPRASVLRWSGGVSLGVFVLLAFVVATKASRSPDQSIDDSLNRFALRDTGVADFFKAVTNAGSPTVTLGLGLLVAVAFYLLRMRTSAYFAATSVVGAYAIAYVAKKGVDRHRPIWDAAHTISTESGASFPSGHATGTSALAAVLILAAVPLLVGAVVRRAVAAVLVLYVIVIAVSRPVLGVHFPTDVLAGAALGAGWTLLCASVLRPWRDRPSAG
ncbi:phosphatase PAP2 family protein [Catenulispora rubra]|uniref:phosphatase PAP2 family protein n=1 Tax=Catenulispora rubra TaxID=280293 RepID=UPI00189260C0|nr:phosphatase PAP2 family protein [Catenulispora rubra]